MKLRPSMGTGRRWLVLAAAVFVVFGALGLSRFSYTSILPFMQAGLRLSNSQAGGLATANLAGYMAMAVVGGALASRFGSRYVITGGLLLAALGMVVTGLAESYGPAVGGRFLSGVGAAAASVPAHTMVALWVPSHRRALAAGIAATGCSLGLVLVGPLIPFLMASWGPGGWRSTWLLLAGAVVIIALMGAVVMRNRPAERPARHQAPATRRPDAFEHPAGWKRIYLTGKVWQLGALYFLFGFAYMAYLTFFTKRLIADAGYSAQDAGTVFMILGWASLVCGILWGWVADRVGRERAMALILLIQALAYSLLGLSTGFGPVMISAVLFGVTAWGVPAIMAAVSSDLVGPALAPAAYGFLTVFHGFGQAAGPYVAGRLADVLLTFSGSYLMAGGVAFLGALGMMAYRRAGSAAREPVSTSTPAQSAASETTAYQGRLS